LNIDKIEFRKWDVSTTSLQNREQYLYYYNSSNTLVKEIANVWKSGAWLPASFGAEQNYYYESYTGIKGHKENLNAIKLYPNPTNSSTHIYVDYFSKSAANTQIAIINLLGQTVGEFYEKGYIGDHSILIPTNELSNSIYLVQIKQEGQVVQSLKFIKN
jgi:hypothetical protein